MIVWWAWSRASAAAASLAASARVLPRRWADIASWEYGGALLGLSDGRYYSFVSAHCVSGRGVHLTNSIHAMIDGKPLSLSPSKEIEGTEKWPFYYF